MSEEPTFPPTLFGVPYPTDYVVATIDDAPEVERAAAALRQAGFATEDVVVLRGGEVLRNIRARQEHRGIFARLAAAIQTEMSDEGLDAKDYERAARRGASLVCVYAPEQAQAERARDVLQAHRAHAVKYYGPWAVTDLSASALG